MSAGKYSFIIEQGSTTRFNIVYKDSTGQPVDLSDYSARMQIKSSYGTTSSIATLSSSLWSDGTGLNMVSSSQGMIQLYISSCTSSLFDFDEAYYDIDIISGSNCPVVERILEGRIRLSREITTLG